MMTAHMEAKRRPALGLCWRGGGIFCDLHPRDGNEPTIVLATFLGEWDRSNMSGRRLWERNGRREAVVVSGCGERAPFKGGPS